MALDVGCGQIVVSSWSRERDENSGQTTTVEMRERYWPRRRREDEKKEGGLGVGEIRIHDA
jgi:hypothetical protein